MKVIKLDEDGVAFCRQYLRAEKDIATLSVELATLQDALLTILRGRRADRAKGGGYEASRRVEKRAGKTVEILLVMESDR